MYFYSYLVLVRMVLDDFSSKAAMKADGWTFNWNGKRSFVKGRRVRARFCKDLPTSSYCGFRYPGDGLISYTFSNTGTATLEYGQSWRKGYIEVKKNNVVIDSRSTRGTSTITFDYSSGDILAIEELDNSVINIHSLSFTSSSKAFLITLEF